MSSHPVPLALLLLLSLCATSLAADPCPRGTFLRRGVCNKCPPGTYQDLVGFRRCLSCPRGTYNPISGAPGRDLCLPCPQGTFNAGVRAASLAACLPCPPGTTAARGGATCITCPAGTYVAAARNVFDRDIQGYDCLNSRSRGCYANFYPLRSRCVPCPLFQFSALPNAFQCESCSGNSSSLVGQTECVTCPPGNACPRGRLSKMFPCKAYLFNDGTTFDCRPCPPGMQGESLLGSAKCVPCPPRTFRGFERTPFRCQTCKRSQNPNPTATGALACLPEATTCPSNYFKNFAGTCAFCLNTHRRNPATNRCEECPANEISNGGRDPDCRACPPGSSRAPGAHRCMCNPGWERILGPELRCEPCAPGTVGSRFERCIDCFPGTYSRVPGSVQCKPCPSNKVQPLRAQTKCKKCAEGLVPNTRRGCLIPETNCPPGHDRVLDSNRILFECSPRTCPAGEFLRERSSGDGTMTINFNACLTCSRGFRYDAASNNCRFCASDETSLGGTSEVCTKCDPGFVGRDECRCISSKEIVAGECRACGAGSIGVLFGQGCRECTAGTAKVSATECRDCPPGTFSAAGASECTPCAQGESTLLSRSSNCVAVV